MFFFESAHPQTYKFDGLDSNHPQMVVVYGKVPSRASRSVVVFSCLRYFRSIHFMPRFTVFSSASLHFLLFFTVFFVTCFL